MKDWASDSGKGAGEGDLLRKLVLWATEAQPRYQEEATELEGGPPGIPTLSLAPRSVLGFGHIAVETHFLSCSQPQEHLTQPPRGCHLPEPSPTPTSGSIVHWPKR